jgi:hypothetical protein
VHWTLDWLGGLLGSADTVIAIPIAWLTIGAIVYGHEVATTPAERNAKVTQLVARRWIRLPRVVQRLLESARDSLRDRFGPLTTGLRVLTRAGVAPMLLFCLAFVLTQTAGTWLFELDRALIGPHDLNHFWMPVSDPLSVLNDAVGTVLIACLVGAAVDRVLSAQAAQAPAAEADAASARIPAPRQGTSIEADVAAWDADTVAAIVVSGDALRLSEAGVAGEL